MSISLYSLTSAMLALMEQEDATNEQIEEVFGLITEKDNRICHLRADIIGEIAKFKAEEDRLAARRKAMENSVKRLEGYISSSMEALAVEKIEAGTFSINMQLNPPSVQIDDESIIPLPYIKVIQTIQIDKKMIASDIKKGFEVPGAHLEQKKTLRIK